MILVISTVEQLSTFGSCQTAESPSHNLDVSPKEKTQCYYLRRGELIVDNIKEIKHTY